MLSVFSDLSADKETATGSCFTSRTVSIRDTISCYSVVPTKPNQDKKIFHSKNTPNDRSFLGKQSGRLLGRRLRVVGTFWVRGYTLGPGAPSHTSPSDQYAIQTDSKSKSQHNLLTQFFMVCLFLEMVCTKCTEGYQENQNLDLKSVATKGSNI